MSSKLETILGLPVSTSLSSPQLPVLGANEDVGTNQLTETSLSSPQLPVLGANEDVGTNHYSYPVSHRPSYQF